MASVNKAIILGTVVRDPENRAQSGGNAIAGLTVVTNEKWTNKAGEKQEDSEFHRVTFFGRTAEVAIQYLTKGSQVYIEGKIKTRKYTDSAGIEKYSTDIIGHMLQMIGSKRTEAESAPVPTPTTQPNNPSGGTATQNAGGDDFLDDLNSIPF